MSGQDQHVRDAVLEAVMHDQDAQVRQTAIGVLEPVQSDSSVRQVLRTVAAQDANPLYSDSLIQCVAELCRYSVSC